MWAPRVFFKLTSSEWLIATSCEDSLIKALFFSILEYIVDKADSSSVFSDSSLVNSIFKISASDLDSSEFLLEFSFSNLLICLSSKARSFLARSSFEEASFLNPLFNFISEAI